MRRKAQSDLITVTIITATVIVLGLALFNLLSNYAGISRLESLEEVNSEILVLRSSISADYVFGGNAYIRNVGKEPVVIFRLVTLNNGTIVWDSGVKNIAKLDVGEVGKVMYECPSCRDSDLIVLQVYYIPSKLYDPSNPELIDPTSRVVLFKVASFQVERVNLGLTGICPVSSNWIWADFLDPIEEGEDGTLSNFLKIRLSKATMLKEITLNVVVEDRDGNLAEGSKTLLSMSNVDETIGLQSNSKLRYPVDIALNVNEQDWIVIPRKWHFVRDETAYVDLVKIIWDTLSHRVIGIFVKAYHDDSGTYRVSVRVYDCNDVLIAHGSSEKDVEAYIWEEYNVALSSNPLITDVYRVEVAIIDVSPLVTVTKTVTETVTETTTRTYTSTVTVPLTTQTTTSTTTSTITRWTTVATSTVTTTTTRTTTIYPTTTTTTRIITTTIPSTTTTVTRTSTSTVGTTVTTTTVRATTTYSSTVATVTQTVTTTVGSTTTMTTTYTTTTTVFRGVSASSNLESNTINLIGLTIILPAMLFQILRVLKMRGGRYECS